MEEKKNALK